MIYKSDFAERIAIHLSDEHKSFFELIQGQDFGPGDLMTVIGYDQSNPTHRATANRFLEAILPAREESKGKKRRFSLYDCFCVALCSALKNSLAVSNALLRDVYAELHPDHSQDLIVDGYGRLDVEDLTTPDARNVSAFDYLLAFYPIARVLVSSKGDLVFLHVRPQLSEPTKPICDFINARDLAWDIEQPENYQYFSSPRTQSAIRLDATQCIEEGINRLVESGHEIPTLPMAKPPYPVEPEIASEAITLSSSELRLIEHMRALRDTTTAAVSVRNGRPHVLEYGVFHPVRDVCLMSMEQDPITRSIKIVLNKKTRTVQGYIQNVNIDLFSADDRKDGAEP